MAEAGWGGAASPKQIADSKSTSADFVLGKQRYRSDLVPASLIVMRYLPREMDALAHLEGEAEQLEQQVVDLAAEQGEEGGLLEDVVDEAGRIIRKTISARLKALSDPESDTDERNALTQAAGLLDRQAAIKSAIKAAREALDTAIALRYADLSEATTSSRSSSTTSGSRQSVVIFIANSLAWLSI